MLTQITTGLVLGLSLAMPVGPGSIEIIKKGLSKGFMSALLVGLGCLSADLVYIALVYFGLASFVKITLVKIIMLLLGGLILIYIGVKGFKKNTKLGMAGLGEKSSYLSGFMIAGVSPFTALFWISVFGSMLSTFVSPIIVLVGIIIGILSWFVILSGLSCIGKKFVSPRFLKLITVIGSVFIIGFGVRFLVLGFTEMLRFIY